MLDITKDIQSLTTFRRRSGEFMKEARIFEYAPAQFKPYRVLRFSGVRLFSVRVTRESI